MAISDAVVANITSLYLAVIAAIKAFGVIHGQSFSEVFVLGVSTTVVGSIVVGTLTWDVSRKATRTYAFSPPQSQLQEEEMRCRGGICWHAVPVRSTLSQVRFRLPQQPLSAPS